MRLNLRLAGIIFSLFGMALSLSVWLNWCPGDGCDKASEFFGVQISLWGAGFYVVNAFLFAMGYQRILFGLLTAGVLAHAVLFYHMFAVGPVCTNCLAAGCLTLVLLIMVVNRGNKLNTSVAVIVGVIALTSSGFAGFTGGKASDTFRIPVLAADGTEVNLDITERPLLYFNYWCPHCIKVLEHIAKMPDGTRPYLVSGVEGDFDSTVRETRNKLATTSLTEDVFFKEDVFFTHLGIESVPTLMVPDKNQVGFKTGVKAIVEYLNDQRDVPTPSSN